MVTIKQLDGSVILTLEQDSLYGADLSSADLSSADLYGADLSSADLSSADLSSANLSRADLSSANLSRANLSSANLSGVDLSGANLYGANLYGANLSGANLSGANLSGVDLYGANLSSANLSSANLSGAKNVPALAAAQTLIAGEGVLIGWKKLQGGTICKLRIPAKAARSNATGRKCRAAYAVVLEGEGVSQHDGKTVYTVGKRVVADKFCPDRWQECAGGIHFFLTREEAEAY